MKSNSIVIALGVFLIFTACNQKKQVKDNSSKGEKTIVSTALVPQGWITKRVAKANKKLNASEAGRIVWKAMEAHGGLQKWYEAGPISFHFNYQPLDGGTARNTYQVIDTWRRNARHFQANDSTAQFGWDGKDAWVMAKDSTEFPYNTRFWSLTPYFFVAQPFVLDGQGVHLELLPEKMYHEKEQHVVKVTFDDGTGDAPDDYYVLYFDKESYQLSVIRYIVSYPGYFKNGGHLPEKFMELHGEQIVNGFLFPKNYKTHWLTETEEAGEHITDITLSNIMFQTELESTYFEIPEKVEVLKGL